MRSRLVRRAPAPVFLLVFEVGDEVVDTLTRFAADRSIDGAWFTAVGAFERATLAWWDVERKEYRPIPVTEQMEVCSLIGNIARLPDGSRKVHAHAVVGLRDGSTRGGHLLEGHVRATLELVLSDAREPFQRRPDEASGLALLE